MADEVERLKMAVEFYGEMADACVWGDTGRRCPYCQCGREAESGEAEKNLEGEYREKTDREDYSAADR